MSAVSSLYGRTSKRRAQSTTSESLSIDTPDVRRHSFNPPALHASTTDTKTKTRLVSAPSSFTNLAHNVMCSLWSDTHEEKV